MIGVDNMLAAALAERKEQARFRKLRNVLPISAAELSISGKHYVNFSSNDYLGLSQNPIIKKRAIDYIERFGVGAGASRLVSGNHELYDAIETKLALLKGTEAALIFSTGYQLNMTVLIALAKLKHEILCDRLSHNSILLGGAASGTHFSRFKHADLVDLERKLRSSSNDRKSGWIVTESVFGMDGDIADIRALRALSEQSCYGLFVDEAHATGVFGQNGMGLIDSNLPATISMGTFGKACGSFGAYLACSREIKDYLINFCSGLIYTTALPPPVLGSIEAALELIPSMTKERTYLLSLADYTRTQLRDLGFNVGQSQSHIIPIILGDDLSAMHLSDHLEQNQLFVPAIRPPTVPLGTARLRLSLSTLHTEAHLNKLFAVLKHWRHSSSLNRESKQC